MVNVDGARAATSARVGQLPSNGALEEALAAFARVLSVVFAATLIPTHHTLHVLPVAKLLRVALVVAVNGRAAGRGLVARGCRHVRLILGLRRRPCSWPEVGGGEFEQRTRAQQAARLHGLYGPGDLGAGPCRLGKGARRRHVRKSQESEGGAKKREAAI